MQLNNEQLNKVAQRIKSDSYQVKPSRDLAQRIINDFKLENSISQQSSLSWFSWYTRFVSVGIAAIVLATVVTINIIHHKKPVLVKQENDTADFMDTVLVITDRTDSANQVLDIEQPEMFIVEPVSVPTTSSESVASVELATLNEIDEQLAIAFADFDAAATDLDILFDQSDLSGF